MQENQRILLTKRMLKEGLLRLLEQKDLDKIHINELCRESGINRATFYRHYETPHDILLEIERDFVGQMVSKHAPENIQEIHQQLESACVYLYSHREVARILFLCNTDSDLMSGLNELYNHYWALWKEKDPRLEIDATTAQVVVTLLGGGCYYLLRQWILEDIPKTPEEICQIMCNIIRWPTPEQP